MDLESPLPYQVIGSKFLAERTEALLADEMGLGKSAQAVIASDLVGAKNILVVCPASVRVNWSREFTRFSPMDRPCTVIFGAADKLPSGGIVVISYDYINSASKKKKLKAITWDVIIYDEAHYLKNRDTGRTKIFYGADMRSGLSVATKRTWRLTGTPAPNNAAEMWPMLFSSRTVDHDYWKFVELFCTGYDDGYGFKITGTKNAEHLKKILQPFMLRRKKDDVMKQLPPITFTDVTLERSVVELDPYFFENVRAHHGVDGFLKYLKECDATIKSALTNIHGNRYATRANNSDVITMLEGMQTSNATLRRYLGMAKVPNFCALIKEELDANPGMKIVIFAIHMTVIEMVRDTLGEFKPVTVYGGTPGEKRQSNIDKFRKNPKCRVFIGNIKAAGTGVDGLQEAASEVAFLEYSWSPADNAQAAMRVHRIGQEKPVRCRFFTCAGSIDEAVAGVVKQKTRELAKIF